MDRTEDASAPLCSCQECPWRTGRELLENLQCSGSIRILLQGRQGEESVSATATIARGRDDAPAPRRQSRSPGSQTSQSLGSISIRSVPDPAQLRRGEESVSATATIARDRDDAPAPRRQSSSPGSKTTQSLRSISIRGVPGNGHVFRDGWCDARADGSSTARAGARHHQGLGGHDARAGAMPGGGCRRGWARRVMVVASPLITLNSDSSMLKLAILTGFTYPFFTK